MTNSPLRFKPLFPPASALLLLFLAAFAPASPGAATGPNALWAARRVVFLGDSITYGGRHLELFESYLRSIAPGWSGELLNLGLPSETVSGLSEDGHAGGSFPRPDLHERLDRVLEQIKPDLVVAAYGMNDGIYLPFSEERFGRFQRGILRLREKVASAGARMIHVTPATFDPVAGAGVAPPSAGYDRVLDRYSEWLMGKRGDGWEVIDVHFPMKEFLERRRQAVPGFRLAGDGVHPNAQGYWILGRELMRWMGADPGAVSADQETEWVGAEPWRAPLLSLVGTRQRILRDAWLGATGHKRPGMAKGLPLEEAQRQAIELRGKISALLPPYPGRKGIWNGFDRYDFAGATARISVIVPSNPRPGRLWAWKGEFLDAFPAVEKALLTQGVHIVYLQVPDLLGAPEAVRRWNECYEQLTARHGMAARPALIALSRAGLYCYNWAAANSTNVACIYADAAVCDFKSWPGGRGKGKGSPRDWKLVLERYGFKTEAEALAYTRNPVDTLAPLAQAKVPLLHVYGDADDVVPWDENTGVVAERYRRLGGDITLIPKPGIGHHPHGLADPTPVVDFILRNLGR